MKRILSHLFICILCLLVVVSCRPELTTDVQLAMLEIPEKIDFNQHVKPILSDRCFACHGPDKAKQQAGLRLDLADASTSELKEHPGKFAIVPGRLSKSEVFHRITSDDADLVMPPFDSDLKLNAYEKAVLIRWIEEGAQYQPHWAYIAPIKPTLPEVDDKFVSNFIDPFIIKKLDQIGLTPAPKAQKEVLLRRVTLDITGLPPTITEMEDFLNDDAPDAYEKAVDRLLSSDHYGEHMASYWMDVARFADTHGYTVDRYRDASPYRDWVINAFNENQPYDEFVTWQLAGDLMPDPSREQLIATAFNRMHQQNMEGGIVQEEFRVEYVADRTNTLGAAFLGLTLECARCHDHKYDPISEKDYYQFFSFFNNIKEAGQISWDNAMPVPTLLLTNEKVDSIVDFLDQTIDLKEKVITDNFQAAEKSFNKENFESLRLDLKKESYPSGLIAHFPLTDYPAVDLLDPKKIGILKQQGVSGEIEGKMVEVNGRHSLEMDGDAWLDLGGVGAFERNERFSIGIWVNVPASLKNGVIFHKGDGAALYNFRGFHLAIKEDQLQIMMAHTEPYNAIIEYGPNIPRDEWVHLTLTYDGSSKANGLKAYQNGREIETKVDQDQLYKSIKFGRGNEPGVQIGARWRGIGIKGGKVSDFTVFDRVLSNIDLLKIGNPLAFKQLMEKDFNELSKEEIDILKAHYAEISDQRIYTDLDELAVLRYERNRTTDTVQELMIMQEMEDKRTTYVLKRGQYNVYGEEVHPGVPSNILEWQDGLPENRLGLAKWLFDPDHPLTSRVYVNRLWQQFFGKGLVTTAEDFGNQGELPSHPALLDQLAVTFIENDWDIKQMVKLIVMSSTYQQSSIATDEKLAKDPDNKFLARGPSDRLTAEMMRDNVLAASELLIDSLGGVSVKPYQPAGLWSINGGNYQAGHGEQLYRRSLYTFWKRTVPHPTQATFDAPNRDICSVKRQKTSTPLQSLVLLNDPVFLEAAKVMAHSMVDYSDPAAGISLAFRKLTGRKITKGELAVLIDLYKSEYEKFKDSPSKMEGWLSAGDYEVDPTIERELLGAYAVVASTIINADATIIKR